ncbi:MAG: arsenosugar biosynthesis-associated peroxidase-like protein [Thermodesulfobacteriota bacterium]
MGYYDPSDLKKFAEVGKFSKELMDKFFEYYNAAVGKDGALTKREKSLIALAVAHTEKCPYCIDAYTTQCLESGADPEQMTEAVHVAASMSAGIKLIHAIQMQNSLKKKGAL